MYNRRRRHTVTSDLGVGRDIARHPLLTDGQSVSKREHPVDVLVYFSENNVRHHERVSQDQTAAAVSYVTGVAYKR